MASDRMSRQEWERIKVEDFDRLEAALATATARAAALAVENAELRAACIEPVGVDHDEAQCSICLRCWPLPGPPRHEAECFLARPPADPDQRGADLIAAADCLGEAVQRWLDDPDVDATQAETDLLSNAYGEWINCRLRSGPGQDGEA
jgi:hypothetical protein